MRNVSLFLLFYLFGVASLFAQTTTDAFAKYEAREYRASAEMFDKALKDGKGTGADHYNAACSWALAGNKEKAFAHLTKAVEKDWVNLSHLKQDGDLKSLHKDKRWPQLLAQVEARKDKVEANYNKPLQAQLEKIYQTDQYYRMMIDSVQKNYGTESVQWKGLLDKMQAQDEENKRQVVAILEKHGWPGKSLVGPTASMAAFLVIQHSDKATMEKYLPLLREAIEKGEASKSNLALMEDRVLINKGLPQLYGSQLRMNAETKRYELYQVEDEANLDKRRAEMGLGPIAEYLKRFGLEYTPKSN
ncbi:hypothetical protein CLV24_113129 [Pontibacter ummariensis]|uniref:Tetratricopeptide repeat-containing protein n=1 Tax=Pontibacter ummariensis TaxID=1610492 RepID=A0A239H8A7_9BACT|nr:DUF6624 domain-containing protein [Pontibacter ummariensis]PRY10710.1 hypothetical protein CLV24_113129 [Pontibacter ummariensis]SNS77639.1 hypothetical protein SAMN06296052_11326 [Pontibacter ummariensis]